jgi:hypothetical protein
MAPVSFNTNAEFQAVKTATGFVPLEFLANHESLIGFSLHAIYELASRSAIVEKKYTNAHGILVRPRGVVSIFLKNARPLETYFSPATRNLICGVET